VRRIPVIGLGMPLIGELICPASARSPQLEPSGLDASHLIHTAGPFAPPVAGRLAVVHRRWIVIDTKSGRQVGKFATRYGAMVFAENLKGPSGRYAVVEQIGPNLVTVFESQGVTGIRRP
jgi:hypothetical protein